MYITKKERYQIEILLEQGKNPYQISKILNRPNPTIYREIKRGMVEFIDTNLKKYKKYCADVAQQKYDNNKRNKGRQWKIGNDLEYVKFIEDMIINKKYSPEAVLLYIKNKKLKFKTTICKTTLYSYIYKGVFLNIKEENYIYKRKRKNSKIIRKNTGCSYKRGRNIEDRNKEVCKRNIYGHWELDTVCGKREKGKCLLVLTERKTRQEIVKLIDGKTTEGVVKAFNEMEKEIGFEPFRNKFKTITCDNGKEFSDFAGIEQSVIFPTKTRTQLYYCHPYSAWERGSNENCNKLIRRWLPKGQSLNGCTIPEIEAIQTWINEYPRKIFNGLSTYELLYNV